MFGHVNESMDKGSIMDLEERVEKVADIYVSAGAVRDMKHKKDKEDFDTQTLKSQASQHTGSDSVKVRSYRAAVVCLVLLCVLLLTAVIVLCVIFTQERQQLLSKNENLTSEREQMMLKNTNLTNEREQLILKNTNLTNEREQLKLKNTNLTNEREQLILKNTNLTNEREQMTLKNTNLTSEREQLILKNTNLTNEREQMILKNTNLTNDREQLTLKNTNLTNERQQLILKNTNLTNERQQLILKNTNLTNERQQLILKNTNLTNERQQLILKNKNLTDNREQLRSELLFCVGWVFYQSSFYYMSNETKNWTESRRDCQKRGADLIIINNREEYDFVQNKSGDAAVYIGLTDSEVEGNWKWVDGSNLTSGFSSWAPGQPDEYNTVNEDCAMTVAVARTEFSNIVGWHDVACDKAFKWICEKTTSQFIFL